MAKRKGKGLDTGIIKVSENLTIDSRIKVGAVLWLQEKYDKDFSEIMELLAKGKFRDNINLIVALAIQHDPEKTEAEIMALLSQVEIEDLTAAVIGLTTAFKTDAKNSKRPVAGNLQE